MHTVNLLFSASLVASPGLSPHNAPHDYVVHVILEVLHRKSPQCVDLSLKPLLHPHQARAHKSVEKSERVDIVPT
ncbi:hypothetical protein HBH56_131820 [Parastagonospora nodorum]|nr:hypothetical protein HBH56_131820 [Parastagonospora nodorum]KAH4629112.1 hypothetical protein HBH55_101370 [Parastagonospora nodorum]KAH4920111.1 hypothetical protein HBI79_195280 [Parastagonospora nodorum]KAH6258041.1 hypothetical protein HBI42_102940 [Parastagonospora nodorum]KAH6538764.1 hypothetical protein HBI07_120240 [Parastagonospora nodorum]